MRRPCRTTHGAYLGGIVRYICGPCVFHSEKEVRATAKALASIDDSITLRAKLSGGGTRRDRYWAPDAPFGEMARRMDDIAVEYGLNGWATEVRTPYEVDCCVANNARYIWIGARNCYNYQLLEHACKSGIDVIVKRGLTMSLDDIKGLADVMHVQYGDGAEWCERGIVSAARTEADRWTYDVTSHIDGLCKWSDPTHGGCSARRVPVLAEMAAGLGATGLMLEVYADPFSTPTDAAWAIGIDTFKRIHSATCMK